MVMRFNRRSFLRTAGAVSLGFTGLHHFANGLGRAQAAEGGVGYGRLVDDPDGVLNLPEGFRYHAFSYTGETMEDGFFVPGAHDGMATFEGSDGKTIVIRNHELSPAKPGDKKTAFGERAELLEKLPEGRTYDRGQGETFCPGGTTTFVYDTKAGKLERQYLSLTGTVRNCAGGPTPWGSWITCEETTLRRGDGLRLDHGYNFEVPASMEMGLTKAVPIEGMGRFKHEAIAVDPDSGVVYQTEDAGDGLIYRFIPNEPERLQAGGRLQCLAAADVSRLDTRNWGGKIEVPVGHSMRVRWIDLDNVHAPHDDLRYRGYGKGAARFARGEGMWYGNEAVYFACTNGGPGEFGQVWKYTPSEGEGTSKEEESPGRLELFAEADSADVMERADNLTVAPWGDIIVCEDGPAGDNLVGITPEGRYYRFAENRSNSSELTGAAFSPDGSTLFVNIQNPGFTMAITGPWQRS
jgi:secreted PhoX family phosphatase